MEFICSEWKLSVDPYCDDILSGKENIIISISISLIVFKPMSSAFAKLIFIKLSLNIISFLFFFLSFVL